MKTPVLIPFLAASLRYLRCLLSNSLCLLRLVPMQDFLKELAAAIPAYFEDLVLLVSGPKRFAADRIAKHHHPLKKSLIFLCISFLIVSVLLLPLGPSDPWPLIGSAAIFTLFYTFAYAAVMHVAWRLVGGVASFRKVLPIYLYFAGVLELLMVITFLATAGAMKAVDPATYKELIDAIQGGNYFLFLNENMDRLLASRALRVGMPIELLCYCAILIWFIAGWGAYRQLHGVSRLRSVIAGILFLLFSLPVTAVVSIIASLLQPSPPPE
jgi:hypothetical protein